MSPEVKEQDPPSIINEQEEPEEELEVPRSYSLPNLIYNTEYKEYSYEVNRDFR